MTYERRDVPITESNAVAKNILVGVCDKCHEVLAVPPQCIPAIQEARDTATVPVEAVLPSIYLDAIDLAAWRIDPTVNTSFRKRLFIHYLSLATKEKNLLERFKATREKLPNFEGKKGHLTKRRFSVKVTQRVADQMVSVMKEAHIANQTDLIKALVVQMDEEIIQPEVPKHLEALRQTEAQGFA